MKTNQNNQEDRVVSSEEAMKMNRKGRRLLGKANKVKITGSNTAHMKETEKPYAFTTFTGIKK